MDTGNWLILIALLLGAFIFLILLLMRIRRILARGVKVRAGKAEDGFNIVNAAQGIANNLRRQGIDVSEAQALLGEAREALASGHGPAAIGYAERAKELLLEQLKASSSGADSAEPEGKGAEGRAEEDSMARLDKASTGEEPPKDTIKEFVEFTPEKFKQRKDNKLPAKFTIQLAEEELGRCRERGDDPGRAEEHLGRAREAFDAGDFDVALRYANKAKRAAMGVEEEPEPTPPRGAGSQVEKGAQGEGNGEGSGDDQAQGIDGGAGAVRFECPECNAELSEDDNFCGKCGVKIEIKMACPGCGTEVEKGDAFCRKCGQRM